VRALGVSQMNLGAAYQHRRAGDRAENLRRTIRAYEAALTVRPADTEPVLHQRTQVVLASARADLARLVAAQPANPRQEEVRNVAEAVVAGTPAELAAAVATLGRLLAGMRPDNPVWAEAQYYVGLLHQIRYGRTEDQSGLDAAADAYRAALRALSDRGDTRIRGSATHNLAAVYLAGPCGPRERDLAIELLLAALPIRTTVGDTSGWARTEYTLASAYLRGPGVTAERAEKAAVAAPW
jgi:hypothetical protein